MSLFRYEEMVAKGKDRTKIQDMTYAIITSGLVSIQDYLCEGSSRLIDDDRASLMEKSTS